jgi:hypothetical protein
MNSDFGNKPSGTKIQVTKDGDFFEIYIPPYGFRPGLFFIAPSVIAWSSCFIAFRFVPLEVQTFFPSNVIFMMFTVILWMVSGYSAYIFLFTVFGKTYLRIDPQEIHLIKTLFDRKVSRERPEPRNEITQLIFTRKCFGFGYEGHPFYRPATVTIKIGVKSLQLSGIPWGTYHESEMEWWVKSLQLPGNAHNAHRNEMKWWVESLQLSGIPWGFQHEPEMEWLAFEISEWLDKPLKVIESPVIS